MPEDENKKSGSHDEPVVTDFISINSEFQGGSVPLPSDSFLPIGFM